MPGLTALEWLIQEGGGSPPNTKRSHTVDLMLIHRLQRHPTLGQRLVCAVAAGRAYCSW